MIEYSWLTILCFLRCTAKWCTYTYTYAHSFFRFFPQVDYYTVLSGVLCAAQQFLVGYLLHISPLLSRRSLSFCPTLWDPVDHSQPGSPAMESSREGHWSGLPCPFSSFTHRSVYMLIPTSRFIPPFLSLSVPIFVFKQAHFCHFFKLHVSVIACGICPSLSDLLTGSDHPQVHPCHCRFLPHEMMCFQGYLQMRCKTVFQRELWEDSCITQSTT